MVRVSIFRRVLLFIVGFLVVGGLALYAATRLMQQRERKRPPAVVDATSTRALPLGKVVGSMGLTPGSHAWMGIPYAQPPVGDLRWRSPQSLVPWSGTRQALKQANPCVQYPSPFGIAGDPSVGGGSEDCLYLNVYAPKMDEASVKPGEPRLPVLVWIHGGGNVNGHSSDYDGSVLAAREKVIVVTINYRLGPFGWFRHAALREASTDPLEKSGNFALLDQIQALRFVKQNISAFGGDPELVTIFGESAGARNVYALLLAKEAAGLFQRAIIQSGGSGFEPAAVAENWSDDEQQAGHLRSSNESLAKMLINAGRANDRNQAKALVKTLPAKEIENFLRSRTALEIMSAYRASAAESVMSVPYLFPDGALLPLEDDLALFAQPDGWNRMPVLVGTNRDENKLFMFRNDLYVKTWFGVLSRAREPELYLATADALSSLWTLSGAENPATAMAKNSEDVFVYRFDFDEWPNLLGYETSKFLGAAHGLEIPFVFGTWELGSIGHYLFTDENKHAREPLSDTMRSYWVNFAKTGVPGRGLDAKLPEWLPWGKDKAKMVFDSVSDGGARMQPQSQSLQLSDIVETINKDPRLKNQRDRCWVFHELAKHVATRRDFLRADYDKLDCARFPFNQFPWQD